MRNDRFVGEEVNRREKKPERLVHGGDWAGFEERFGYEPLDFSVNVSPLGLTEGIKTAVIEMLETADRYPDPLCRRLRKAIAEREQVEEGSCLCGNGADDLIFRLAAAVKPRKALITAPTFSEYRAAMELQGTEIEEFELKEIDGFSLTEEFIEHIKADTDIVFICEPNNPTGVTTPRNLLKKILERCAEVGALLVIDECFNDFLDEPESQSMREFLYDFDNLLILKSFTKLYAMAGIRLGYCLCYDENLLKKIRKSGQEWSVSSLAENAGLAALREVGYVSELRRLVKSERERVVRELGDMGIDRVYGEADYLLFHAREGLADELETRGILLRRCENYSGLGPGWFRIGLKKREDNNILLKAMKEVL